MSDYSDLPEDNEARPMRSRSRKRGKNSKSLRFGNDDDEFERRGKKSKSLRFGNDDDEFEREEKDTPPTRSRSRPGKSRVAFGDEPKVHFGQPLKSVLAGDKSG